MHHFPYFAAVALAAGCVWLWFRDGKPTVAKATADLRKAVDRLKTAEQAAVAEAAQHAKEIAKRVDLKALAHAEADKARKVISNVEALFR